MPLTKLLKQPPPRLRLPGPVIALLLVAVAYVVLQVIFADRPVLGWDESIYVSQVSTGGKAMYFSAPRSRGITLLVAPAAALTSSVALLRLWMGLVSGVGLVVAFWPWLTLLRRYVVPLAATLFISLWVVEFYGDQIMPNLYVAYGALTAAGWFVHAARSGNRRPLIALGASVAFTALVRPADAAFLVAALGVAALIQSRFRVFAAMTVGALAGVLPWIIEAYVRFGGVLSRMKASSYNEGTMGWHPAALWMELKALNGPTLCRPCTVGWRYPELSMWWLALPFLVVLGLVVTARAERGPLLVAAACGAAAAFQYLFLIVYAAPRFLIPAYALSALVVAALIEQVVAKAPKTRRTAVIAAIGLLLAVQFGTQHVVLQRREATPTGYPQSENVRPSKGPMTVRVIGWSSTSAATALMSSRVTASIWASTSSTESSSS